MTSIFSLINIKQIIFFIFGFRPRNLAIARRKWSFCQTQEAAPQLIRLVRLWSCISWIHARLRCEETKNTSSLVSSLGAFNDVYSTAHQSLSSLASAAAFICSAADYNATKALALLLLLDQELIPYRYSSCCSCCSSCYCSGNPLQKSLKAPSFQIGSGWSLAKLFFS